MATQQKAPVLREQDVWDEVDDMSRCPAQNGGRGLKD